MTSVSTRLTHAKSRGSFEYLSSDSRLTGLKEVLDTWIEHGSGRFDAGLMLGRWIEAEEFPQAHVSTTVLDFLRQNLVPTRASERGSLTAIQAVQDGDEIWLGKALNLASNAPLFLIDISCAEWVKAQLQNEKLAGFKQVLSLLKPIVLLDARSHQESPNGLSLVLQAFASTDVVLLVDQPLPSAMLYGFSASRHVLIPPRSRQDRIDQWTTVFRSSKQALSMETAEPLADRYSLSQREVEEVAVSAKNLIDLSDTNGLFDIIRTRIKRPLEKLARPLSSTYRLSDIVLPPSLAAQFEELRRFILTQRQCLETLGFETKHARGGGVHALFRGPSGTGKTMAAEVLANEIGLPLYIVDLSSVVSKYIGETEKHLRAIFEAAAASEGILLFDEGDALFGKRGSVNDSTDRYANMEINLLLQELERHKGITILTTNLADNLDDAFRRRFQFDLQFPKPSAQTRKAILLVSIPEKVELDPNVDLDHLSRFDLTGGNIQTVVRLAASYAAYEKRRVGQIDFLRAVRREYERMGYPIVKEDFGEKYWKSIAPDWEEQRFRAKNRKFTIS